MKTRTLLLLSLACGLAILLAGGALLVQIVNRSDVPEASPLGVEVPVGDMRVLVQGSTESAGRLDVDVLIGGVDDPDGTGGFRAIASGRPAPLIDTCGPTTEAVRECTLSFEVNDSGSSRVLFYERGDQRARWILVGQP